MTARQGSRQPCWASTRTPCCARCGSCATKGSFEFRRGHLIKVAGTPDRSALITKATELLRLSRRYGYQRDELIELIEQLPSTGRR